MIVHLGYGGDAVKCSVIPTKCLEWEKRCHETWLLPMSILPKSAYIYLINSDVGFGKK